MKKGIAIYSFSNIIIFTIVFGPFINNRMELIRLIFLIVLAFKV